MKLREYLDRLFGPLPSWREARDLVVTVVCTVLVIVGTLLCIGTVLMYCLHH